MHRAELPSAGAGLFRMSQLHTKYEVLKQPLQRFSYKSAQEGSYTGFYCTHPARESESGRNLHRSSATHWSRPMPAMMDRAE